MAGSMVYRLRVAEPDTPHMTTFRAAMSASQAILDNRGYNHIAGFHGAPDWFCWHHQQNPRTPLQARLFLPWHRAYLWWLEQALKDIDENVALPWWDWTTDRRIPTAYGAPTVDGAANPLRKFRMRVPATQLNAAINRNTRRSPGPKPFGRLATEAEIEALYGDGDWASFSDRLQTYHDGVHVWVGADMADQSTAGFDPIFFAHHCMIDRVWYLWQGRWGNGGIPNGLLDLPLTPFGKTVRDVLDVQALGYEYAAETILFPGAEND